MACCLPAGSEGEHRARARCRISAALGGLSIIAAYGLVCKSRGSRKAPTAPGLWPAIGGKAGGCKKRIAHEISVC